MVEGYDLLVGGGAGERQALGRLVRKSVPFSDLPPMILSLLTEWMQQRDGAEDFQSWTARHSEDALAEMLNLPLPLREGVGGASRARSAADLLAPSLLP
jgi:sulfite reductase beta subunit-like hemoprotein